MKFRHYTRFVFAFLGCSVLFGFLVMAAVYIVDPLQFYRKAEWYPPLYSKEQRYQNPGLAKNYEYDTIIIGSSMTENFVPSYVDQVMGGKTLKLSMSGSTSKEHYLIAKVALETGKVKRIIWGLDYFSMRGGPDYVRDDQGGFPYHLYDNNPLNDVKYLFNHNTLKDFATIVATSILGNREAKNLDYLNNWDYAADYGRDNVIATWKRARTMEVNYGLNEDPLERVQQTFEQNIHSLIREYPDVEYIFYYPPYTVLRHHVWYELNPVRFNNQLKMKEYIFDQIGHYENVRIYDFQSEEKVTFNLDEYKDISHHSQKINEWIIQQIAAGNYLVTADNVKQFNRELEEQVAGLDLAQFDPDYVHVFVNGVEQTMSTVPKVVADEVFVPLRWLSEQMDVPFEWDPERKQAKVTVNGDSFVLTSGDPIAQRNGGTVQLKQAPKIIDGKMMLPVRALSPYWNLQVLWDQEARKLEIHFAKNPQ